MGFRLVFSALTILTLLCSNCHCMPNSSDGDDFGDDALSFTWNPTKLWENGTIYYKFIEPISIDTEDPERFTFEEKVQIRETMDYIISNLAPGCLSFTYAPEPENKAGNFIAHFSKTTEGKCSSDIGRNLKIQEDFITEIKLGSQCFEEKGTVLHEILHAVGAAHEHIRPDRDEFVTVDLGSVTEENNWRKQYTKKQCFQQTKGTPYDFFTLMHYTQQQNRIAALDKDNSDEVMKINPPYDKIFKQNGKLPLDYEKDKLTAVDIVEISRNYDCKILPQIQVEYLKYVSKITKGMLDHLEKTCLNGSTSDNEVSCKERTKIAQVYVKEWMLSKPSSSDMRKYRRILSSLEQEHNVPQLRGGSDSAIPTYTGGCGPIDI